ncbi:deoxyribodipyrimidine photo-lyase-like [Oratosquilla oratoria]|uniref:deoxyribodipyrimidine photo-lyase-like n=1 Tax=Oratosquilla oratoria TaxID=337810 RepID=UPI003F7731D8
MKFGDPAEENTDSGMASNESSLPNKNDTMEDSISSEKNEDSSEEKSDEKKDLSEVDKDIEEEDKNSEQNKDTEEENKDTEEENKDTEEENKDTEEENKDTEEENKDTEEENKDSVKDNEDEKEEVKDSKEEIKESTEDTESVKEDLDNSKSLSKSGSSEEPPESQSGLSEEPPAKKAKIENSESDDIHSRLKRSREKLCPSVKEFKFNKKRVRMLTKAEDIPDGCNGIVYWMCRDQRIQDNWALLFAQRLALKSKVSLHVVFCLIPKLLDSSYRHFDFLLKGLQEVEKECQELNIQFHLFPGYARDVLPDFIEKFNIGGVVTDFSPLRTQIQWIKDTKKALPKKIPMCQVDAHNIVPCWVTSDKQEYSAKTIRKKIHNKLPDFLTKFPPVCRHTIDSEMKAEEVDWETAEKSLEVDMDVEPVKWATPGTRAGIQTLDQFCRKRLKYYADKRNDPNSPSLSNLSPWLHFGQISAQRCVLEVKTYKKHSQGVETFIEEAVVRRELSDNFCFYQENYDTLDGAYSWARTTLNDHKKDKRHFVYSTQEFEEARTHDDLWNSAQIQLLKEGKIHGFLRMYWCKKILEWTASPEDALKVSLYLNDKYSLDGTDPNGYVGCMWSICGIHDQGWAERDIFGKIRFMNYDGCKRKFNISAFVAFYGGKKHIYNKSSK